VAFVDTSDIWPRGKWERAAVSFAGPYTNLMLAGLAMLLVPLTGSLALQVALSQFALTGYALGLLNMNPLLEFDGYYVLMDWLEIPNFRSKALAYLGKLIWRARRTQLELRHAQLFSLYAVASIGYVLFLVWSILQGYRLYLAGLVSLVAPPIVADAVGWVLGPTMGWLILRRAWNDLRAGLVSGPRPDASAAQRLSGAS
jgi:putative peptide zinc metalloprotease protein